MYPCRADIWIFIENINDINICRGGGAIWHPYYTHGQYGSTSFISNLYAKKKHILTKCVKLN